MGKKKRIRLKPGKFGRKYSAHPAYKSAHDTSASEPIVLETVEASAVPAPSPEPKTFVGPTGGEAQVVGQIPVIDSDHPQSPTSVNAATKKKAVSAAKKKTTKRFSKKTKSEG